MNPTSLTSSKSESSDSSQPYLLPEQNPRVESGPIRFGEDWPGLFLRGDSCISYAYHLDQLLKRGHDAGISRLIVENLLNDLHSTRLEELHANNTGSVDNVLSHYDDPVSI
ncbi:MAG: hypothetical protein ABR924_18805 [Terracidiphilus sp.]